MIKLQKTKFEFTVRARTNSSKCTKINFDPCLTKFTDEVRGGTAATAVPKKVKLGAVLIIICILYPFIRKGVNFKSSAQFGTIIAWMVHAITVAAILHIKIIRVASVVQAPLNCFVLAEILNVYISRAILTEWSSSF